MTKTFFIPNDAENRLISVTPLSPQNGDKKTEYAYDYMSRRIQKNVYEYDAGSWVLNTEKSFVYDSWNLIREQTTTGGTTTIDYYVWGLDLSGSLQGAGGIGGLLAKTNNLTSKTYVYTFDANGNVGQLVDSNTGTIAAHYEYDPFGKLLVSTGSEAANNVFRFSTKYYDAETELYDYGRRYYSPSLGRWVTRDPIGEQGGLNLYGFVRNNSVNYIDPYGFEVDEAGIEDGRYIYTCNCGWLDRDHYSGYSRHYIAIFNAMKANRIGEIILQSTVQINRDVNRRYFWNLPITTEIDYYTEAMKLLYIFARREELDQSGAGLGFVGTWTSFAYEDIASDMFGGLIGKLMLEEGLPYNAALEKARTGCIVVETEQALTVFRDNQRIIRYTQHEGAAQSDLECDPDPCEGMESSPYPEWEEILTIADPDNKVLYMDQELVE